MTEDLKVIEEILGFGDIKERLWESAIDYVEEDKTKAIAHFHKLKRVYEIFEKKCPLVLVFVKSTELKRSWYTYETKEAVEENYINDERITVSVGAKAPFFVSRNSFYNPLHVPYYYYTRNAKIIQDQK